MIVVTSSSALAHVARVLQRSVGNVPFQHVTLRADDGVVEFFHDDGAVETIVRLEAEVVGEAFVALRARLLVDVLRRLPRGRASLSFDGDRVEVQAGKLSYGLVAEPAVRLPPAIPPDGVRVDEATYLGAFRRVVRASDRAKSDPNLVRIASSGVDLRIDSHGFDRSASDVLPGLAGTFGDRPAVVELDSLAGIISRFDGHRGPLTIARTESPEAMWLIGQRPRLSVTVAVSTALSAAKALDAAGLMAEPRTNTLGIEGLALRRALKRCALAKPFEAVGSFVTFRLGEADRCELLAQGSVASFTQMVPCDYAGDVTELTLRGVDLDAASGRLKGTVVISFADNEHSVLISDTEHFRCVVRPLPPAVDGGPQYPEQAQDLAFPVQRTSAAE